MLEYLKIKENQKEFNCIKIKVFYDKGDNNYYRPRKRGYYLSATPCKKYKSSGVAMELVSPFDGSKMFLKEVKRKSAGAEKEAEGIAEKYKKALIQLVAQENNLELEEV